MCNCIGQNFLKSVLITQYLNLGMFIFFFKCTLLNYFLALQTNYVSCHEGFPLAEPPYDGQAGTKPGSFALCFCQTAEVGPPGRNTAHCTPTLEWFVEAFAPEASGMPFCILSAPLLSPTTMDSHTHKGIETTGQ